MAAPPRIARAVPLLAALLLVSACGSGSTSSPTTSSTSTTAEATTTSASSSSTSTSSTSPRSRTTTTTSRTASTTTASTSTAPATAPESTSTRPTSSSTAATGPQTCGQVSTVTGSSVTVKIVSGDYDCDFAETLMDTYYNDPPSPLQGSGGFVTIDGWDCITATLPEVERTGNATTCRTSGGDTIRTVTTPGSSSATASPTTEAEPSAAPSSQASGSCAQIDQPTLDALFPDGVQDEAKCRSYIGGENAIDAER